MMEEKPANDRGLHVTEGAEVYNSTRHIAPPRRAGQKLERYISLVPSVAFNAVLQASWSAVAVSFQAGLLNGGPTSLVWGMLLSWVGTTAVAASLAEMASMNPSVGAQYAKLYQ
jgi:choline transport protein